MSDSLECAICFEIFREPRTLTCQHTFCNDCLEKTVRENVVQCAVCRTSHTVPAQGVKGFLRVLAIQHEIESRCVGCRRTRPQPNSQQQLCLGCTLKRDECRVLQGNQGELESLIKRLETDISGMETTKTEFPKRLVQLEEQIIQLVKDRFKMLKDEGDNMFVTKLNSWLPHLTEHLNEARQFTTDHQIRPDDDIDVDNIRQLVSTCEDYCSRLNQFLTVKPDLSTIKIDADIRNIKPIIQKFGRITGDRRIHVMAAQPDVIGEKGKGPGQYNGPHDVCQQPDTGRFWVADCDNRRLQLLTESYQHVRDIPVIGRDGKKVWPWRLHITRNGDLLVTTSTHEVIMYSRDGTYRKHLDTQWTCPCSITSNQTHIYISDSRGNCIQVFDLEGNHVREIPFTFPWCISAIDDHLIVSSKRSIHHVATDGTILRTVDLANLLIAGIQGLTVSGRLIYLATRRDPIHILDDGLVVSKIGECGSQPWNLNKPMDITVTKDNKLLVANMDNHNLLAYTLED